MSLQHARLTAGASAAGVLRPEPRQASSDNLTATPLAGHDWRQVYSPKSYDTSARHLRTRRGSRSAACAGWAARGCPYRLLPVRWAVPTNGRTAGQRWELAEPSRDGSLCASADEHTGDSSAAFTLSLGGTPNYRL